MFTKLSETTNRPVHLPVNRIIDHSTRFISIECCNDYPFKASESSATTVATSDGSGSDTDFIKFSGNKSSTVLKNNKNMCMVCWMNEHDKNAIRKIPLRNSCIFNTISERGPCLCIISSIGAFEFLCSEDFPIHKWNSLLRQNGYKIYKFWDLFRIIKCIGSGSFSNVFVALHTITGEQIIIKSVNKSKVKQSNIYTEIEILRNIDHPYIVKLNSAFEDDGKIFLVLEYLKGGEIFSWISKYGCYTEDEARDGIRRILLALYKLHCDGIVHRDVKSENLMLECPSKPGSTKLIDFGLASKLKSSNMKMRCGSPGYVAPEILMDIPYNSKVDIFSTGVTLYTMLAGYPPFTGQTVKETLRKNLKANLVFHKANWKHLPHSVKDLIQWMCCSEPLKRCSALQALTHPWFQGIPNGLGVINDVIRTSKTKREILPNSELSSIDKLEQTEKRYGQSPPCTTLGNCENFQKQFSERRWSWNAGDFE